MDNSDRILGRLEEFKEWAREEFSEIKKDLKELQHFKWKVTGMAIAVSAITSIIIEVMRK